MDYGAAKSTVDDTGAINSSEAVNLIGFGAYQKMLIPKCGLVRTAMAMQLMLLSFLLPTVKEEWDLSSQLTGLIGAGGSLFVSNSVTHFWLQHNLSGC